MAKFRPNWKGGRLTTVDTRGEEDIAAWNGIEQRETHTFLDVDEWKRGRKVVGKWME